MKVVFLEDVSGVANGGDIRNVKNGFARNYLFPKNLAVPATHNSVQQVKKLSVKADDVRLKVLSDMKELGEILDGTRVTIEARSGPGGRLYGSVTNIMIAEQLSKTTNTEVDRQMVVMAESFREIGLADVGLNLHKDVDAQISVLIHPEGTDPDEFASSLAETADTKDSDNEAESTEDEIQENQDTEEDESDS